MNWDRIEGHWKQAKGTLQEHWGRVTNNYISMIDGRRMKQLGEIQTTYGIARDQAMHQVRVWKKGNKRLTVVSPDSRRIAGKRIADKNTRHIDRCTEGIKRSQR